MADELKERVEQCVYREDPHLRPFYTEAEVQAVRATMNGKGSARQQRMGWEWLMRACGKDDMSYRPDDALATAFAEGKRKVALDFVWMLRSAPSRTDPDKIAARHLEDDPNARPDNR